MALEAGIRCFNLESESELERLNRVAGELGKVAAVSFRVNPDVDPKTHPYISTGLKQNKFGVPIGQAQAMYRRAAQMSNVAIHGVDCHIGSQLTDLSPIADAIDRVLGLGDRLAADGIRLKHIDIGGGVGIRYQDETPPDMAQYREVLQSRFDGRAGLPGYMAAQSLVDAGHLADAQRAYTLLQKYAADRAPKRISTSRARSAWPTA